MANATTPFVTPSHLRTPLHHAFAQLENVSTNLNAARELFKLIGLHTRDQSVVCPLSEAGEKLVDNLFEDLNAALEEAGIAAHVYKGASA